MIAPFRLLAIFFLAAGLAANAGVPVREPGCCSTRPSAEALHARFEELAPRLAASPFGRPVYLQSREAESFLRGEVFAIVDHPFEQVRDSLQRPQSWCEVMLLPFNTKGCSAEPAALHVYIGRRSDTTLADAFRVDFRYAVRSRDADFLHVALDAANGPLGTHDYHISLEATPGDRGRTYLHFSYAYGFGLMSRMAMSAYLATVGADKVGFSKDSRGNYVGGVRGVLERNTMRYFLAIEAFLDALEASPEARVDKRLHAWFTAILHYPKQLHEMDAEQYFDMKRREYSRLAAR